MVRFLFWTLYNLFGLPSWLRRWRIRLPTHETSPMAQAVKNLPAMQEKQEMQVWSLGWEDLLEEEMATCSSILAWKNSHGQSSLAGYSPWGSQRGGHDGVTRHAHRAYVRCSHNTHFAGGRLRTPHRGRGRVSPGPARALSLLWGSAPLCALSTMRRPSRPWACLLPL